MLAPPLLSQLTNHDDGNVLPSGSLGKLVEGTRVARNSWSEVAAFHSRSSATSDTFPDGGRKRNRTAVRGFAVLCIATLPSGREGGEI